MVEWVTIGRARLALGDCRDVLPTLGNVDAVVTDPPYGLADKLQGGTWGKKYEGSNWDARAGDLSGLPDVPTIAWGGNYLTVPPSRCWLIWYKRDAVRTMADCELAWTNFDANARVFDWTIAATNPERVGHPTQKPIALMKWCLGFLPNAQTILDPFMGSGTTASVALQHGRQYLGCELNPDYKALQDERLRQPSLLLEAA